MKADSPLRFSRANAKTHELRRVEELQRWLENGRKIYSLDLASGWSCPFAKDCLAKVTKQPDGRRKLVDGSEATVRCFSASQEAQYTNLWNLRWGNFAALRGLSADEILDLLESALPHDAGIVRAHVAGDFFSEAYFLAWVMLAERHPDRLFYAYTKSLPYWVKHLERIPDNLVLTASRGGRRDDLIDKHGFREAVIVFSEAEADRLGLDIDHDDSHAARPSLRRQSFALLIHGTQPAGTEAAAALQTLRKTGTKHSYSR